MDRDCQEGVGGGLEVSQVGIKKYNIPKANDNMI